jgi:hypothetical protein
LIGKDIKYYEGLLPEVAEVFNRKFFGLRERLGTMMEKGKCEME